MPGGRGCGSADVYQIGAKRVLGSRMHLGMRSTNQSKRASATRVREIRGQIAAKERERFLLAESVPQLLKAVCGKQLTVSGEDIDHITVNAKPLVPWFQLSNVCMANAKMLRKYAIRHAQAFWPRPSAS
jgi:hypothetical protein